MNIVKKKLSELIPADYNPRKDLKPSDPEYQKIKRSITEFDCVEPIIWNKRSKRIVGGHQRIKVLKELGYKEIEVSVVDLPDEKEKALNIALNKIGGEFDEVKLEALFNELRLTELDLSLTGFDEIEWDKLIGNNGNGGLTDPDAVPQEVEPICKTGDLWQLGRHRLLCGDSANIESFKKLIGNKKAQLIVTSPPYGVGKVYETKGIAPWFDTIFPVIKNLCQFSGIICWNIIDWYCTGGQFIEPTNAYSISIFSQFGFKPIWIRIWEKQGQNHGVAPYHLVSNKPVQQYEYLTAFSNYAFTEEDEQRIEEKDYSFITAFASHSYKFVKRLEKQERKAWGYSGIWKINTVVANKEHPAMFPVELPVRCIKMHSDENDIILEPFCGSGTTIIACEKLKRICHAIELSPHYCDVIINRWQNFTGGKAELIPPA